MRLPVLKKILLALALLTSPAWADSAGSVTGGSRGSLSDLAGCTYNSTPPTLTTGQQVACQVDASGRLVTSGGGTASSIAATPASGFTIVATPGNWALTNLPIVNTQATITRAAGAAGVRHIATSITATFSSGTSSAGGAVVAVLRDGSTGAGTILWQSNMQFTAAVDGGQTIVVPALNILGSPATAMTLEFTAAGGANTFESVSVTGYDVTN